jgi:hypothetical protein
MLLVLVQVGPSCPHVNSRLIMSLSSVDWAVYRRLHFLPTVSAWLGYPSFVCLAWDPIVCTLIHTVTSNIICMIDRLTEHALPPDPELW